MPKKTKTANFIINPAAVIKRDSKGRFLTQPPKDVRDPVGDAHRPTLYDQGAEDFAAQWFAQKRENKEIGWIEELALELDVDDTTLINWANARDDSGNLAHPKFFATYKQIMSWQKMVLKNNGISGKFNGRMSMFLLSANHDTVEKKEVANKYPDGDGVPVDLKNVPKALDPKEFNDWATQRLKQSYTDPAR